MSDPLTLLNIVQLIEAIESGEKSRKNQKHFVVTKEVTTSGTFRPSKKGVRFPIQGSGRVNRIIIKSDGDFTIQLTHDSSTIIRTFSQLMEERIEWSNIAAYYDDRVRTVIISDVEFCNFFDLVIIPNGKRWFKVTVDILVS